MKTKAITTIMITIFLVTITNFVMAKPVEMTIPIRQAQFQCRLWDPPGWRYVYQNWQTEMDLVLKGRVLHGTISYSPGVTNEEGTSVHYIYDGESDLWIMHEGTISYTSPYSGLTITEYWRGYLAFDGTPSASTFEHGVGYQWGYIYGDDPTWYYTHAVWDETMGAWLLGFSIYLWDTDVQDYDVEPPYEDPEFPDPFIEPVPAEDYNPMDL